MTLADCTLIAKRYEPVEAVKQGEEVHDALRRIFMKSLARTLPSEALRTILSFSGMTFAWHDEQCTLAEYSAHIVRDVAAHIDLAAEARIKEKGPKSASAGSADTQIDSDDGDEHAEPSKILTVEDVGNVGWEDDNHGDIEELNDSLPLHPLRDHSAALRCVFQCHMVDAAKNKKTRLSEAERDCLHLSELYESQMALQFGLTRTDHASIGPRINGITLGEEAATLFSLQKARIEAMRQQVAMEVDSENEEDNCRTGVFQPRNEDSKIVPLPLAQQGPAALAWHLLQEINATNEQIDAVSLFALSLQRRFDSRPDKTSLLLPIATATGNHEALWLGGGGVGKTRTLTQVVEPMAITYFGKNGYLATAQANHAAQQLGPRGRTLHTANGLLATSSLQTAKLALNDMSRKKLDRLKGELGVEVTDELGCIQGDLLHADDLRTVYGRAQRHNLDPMQYMRTQERWGRMPARLLCGDFLQLPPVPASASLVASSGQKTSYEHQQGVALLASIEYVVDFVEMKRFNDPLQLQLLQDMRIPGGRRLSEETWTTIENTVQKSAPDDCCDWFEAAYEWRTVSYAMHAKARLQARRAKKVLFYIQAVDKATESLSSAEYTRVTAEPNLSTTKKLAGILPVFIGMEMVLQKTYLPPRYTPGTVGTVVGIELDPNEPAIATRTSIASSGCVLLRHMPKYIYLKVPGTNDNFLRHGNNHASTAEDEQWNNVIAIEPDKRNWQHKREDIDRMVTISRKQFPLLVHKCSTLHGIQGKTAEPGIAAHWKFPKRLSPEARWLAHYVILSRPRNLKDLVSYGVPDRSILESGPPAKITDVLDRLFAEKIKKTKIACREARLELGWTL